MSAATAWAYVMALVTGALALWGVLCLLGSAARRLAPKPRPITGHQGTKRSPPASMPPMTSLPPTAAQTRRMRGQPGSGPPLTAMPPTASQSMAGPMVPVPGVTLQVTPCGCIWYHRDTVREPCPGHRAAAADRAEINRLDQQIRNMP